MRKRHRLKRQRHQYDFWHLCRMECHADRCAECCFEERKSGRESEGEISGLMPKLLSSPANPIWNRLTATAPALHTILCECSVSLCGERTCHDVDKINAETLWWCVLYMDLYCGVSGSDLLGVNFVT